VSDLKYGEVLDTLRHYSRPVRILVLCVFLILLLLTGHERYNWPAGWPTQAMWLNLLIALGLILVISCLVLTDLDQKPSLNMLPEVKPITGHSLKYFKLERRLGAGRKDMIREVESQIRAKGFSLSNEEMQRCAGGPWEFDRIVYHLIVRYQTDLDYAERMRGVRSEMLILNTTGWEGSLAPLHYAIEAVFDWSEDRQPPKLTEPDYRLITEILRKLNGWKTRLRRLVHLDTRGDKIINNCQVILGGREQITRQKITSGL